MKAKRKVLLITLLVLIPLILLTEEMIDNYWMGGLTDWWNEMVFGKTIFSTHYHEYNYRKIAVGMPSAEVKQLLGEPLKILPEIHGDIWSYTMPKILDKDGRGGDCNYTERFIVISNGIVVGKRYGFYFD